MVLDELQDKASEVIARATGAEAGMVTGGAEAGLAARDGGVLAGTDPAKIASLPDTTGMKNEAIMHRAHRNGYDHGVRAAGATIVDIGYGELDRCRISFECGHHRADGAGDLPDVAVGEPGGAVARRRPARSPTQAASRCWWTPPRCCPRPST